MINLVLILAFFSSSAHEDLNPKAEARIEEQREILSELLPLLKKKWKLLEKDEECVKRWESLNREHAAQREKLDAMRVERDILNENNDMPDPVVAIEESLYLSDEIAVLSKEVDSKHRELVAAFARHRNNVIRIEKLNKDIDPLLSRLKVIETEIQLCVIELGNPPPWRAHDECGEMVDQEKLLLTWDDI